MKDNMPGLTSITTGTNVLAKHDRTGIVLPLFKDESNLLDRGQFLTFVKSIEKDIRRSKEYAAYIARMHKDLGLNFCAYHSNINSEIAPIEMHHTLFTLYDVVEIVMTKMLKNGENVFSSLVSHKVMEEHWKDHILVTMLCEMCHKNYHVSRKSRTSGMKPFFLNIDLSFGNIVAFVEDHIDCLGYNHIGKIVTYMKQYEMEKESPNPLNPFFSEVVTNWEDKINNR